MAFAVEPDAGGPTVTIQGIVIAGETRRLSSTSNGVDSAGGLDSMTGVSAHRQRSGIRWQRWP
jgi:hypothetical protein